MALSPARRMGGRRGRALALAFLLSLAGCGLGDLRTYQLTISSNPAGAEVYVNGVLQGKTPLIITYKVELGDVLRGFELRIHKEGYLSIRREVPYNAGNLHFNLVRPRYQP